ncbi:hypothetical protein MUB15_01840 [Priestia sp. OVS21]|nr:hypothetical protein [Priestia sp. OVS21]
MSRFYRRIVLSVLFLFLVTGMISPAQAQSDSNGGVIGSQTTRRRLKRQLNL